MNSDSTACAVGGVDISYVASDVPLGLLSLDPILEGISLKYKLKRLGLPLYCRPFEINKTYNVMTGTDEGQQEVLEYLSELGVVSPNQVCEFDKVSHLLIKDKNGEVQLTELPRSEQWHFGRDDGFVGISIDRFEMSVSIDQTTGILCAETQNQDLVGFFIAGSRTQG